MKFAPCYNLILSAIMHVYYDLMRQALQFNVLSSKLHSHYCTGSVFSNTTFHKLNLLLLCPKRNVLSFICRCQVNNFTYWYCVDMLKLVFGNFAVKCLGNCSIFCSIADKFAVIRYVQFVYVLVYM